MPQRDVFSQVQVDVTTGAVPDGGAPADDTPFHIAIVGNFGGRSGEPSAGSGALLLSDRRPHRVDRDDLDSVLALIAPRLTLDLGGDEPVVVSFASLDDFHPDSLHARLPMFAALRELRQQLSDPRTFASAAAGLRSTTAAGRQAAAEPHPSAASTADRLAGGSLLDEIVAAAPDSATHTGSSATGHPTTGSGGELATFLQRVVAPHLVADADPRQQELLASVDAASTALLRLILAHPRVRSLEALWRGLDLLVRRVETDSSLRLAIIDASSSELAGALANESGDVRDGAVYRMLHDGTRTLPGAAPWSLLVGLDPIGVGSTSAAEVALLDGLARVAAALGAPWVTAAPTAIARPEAGQSPPAGWETLRRSPQGRWLGLAFPSLLLRLPYGKEGDECDALPGFEELEPGRELSSRMEELCWGSPALVPALVLSAAFTSGGWAMRPADHVQVDRLPLYLHRAAGSVVAVPPTRRLLDDDEIMRLLAAGVMPLVATREGDAARLASLQSVAEPSTTLSGRWRA